MAVLVLVVWGYINGVGVVVILAVVQVEDGDDPRVSTVVSDC